MWLGRETGHIGVFVRLRRLLATPGELAEQIMKLAAAPTTRCAPPRSGTTGQPRATPWGTVAQ
jgi:hypothetical protein